MIQNKPILIVEDDKNLATVIQDIIEMLDYESIIISDGAEVIRYLKDNVPPVILLDMHLPTITGTDILHYLQGNPAFAVTQIIVLTADSVLQRESEIYTTALLKPVNAYDLINAVKTAMEKTNNNQSD